MSDEVRVLILEDDHHDAVLIENELRNSKIKIILTVADSKGQFLDKLGSALPDIILSDFTMPAFDGLAALELAKKQLPDVPFIFVSGTIGEEKAIEALKNGATDYILKDHMARLGPAVDRALREAKERVQRRQAEAEWRQQQELFRLITENVADLIAVLDLEGKRLYNSRSYNQILGDPDSLRGTDSFQEIHPEDRERIKELFFDTVNTGVGHRAEFRFIGKRNEIRYIESHGSVIRDAVGNISKVVVVSRDVTDRKKAELEKETLEEQFRQAQKMESIGTLAGGMAHDFNNLLAVILGYASLIERSRLPPDAVATAAMKISKAAERGGALVKQLMTFARKAESVYEPVEVNAVITEVKEMLTATLPKTIKVLVTPDEALPAMTADSGQLHQALLNLCVNARDAMPNGGTISMRTEVVNGNLLKKKYPGAESLPYVAIHISDTGIGMDEATRTRIFEPFFTTKPHGKGTGLGLAMVYGVVKGHTGFIDVDSKLGTGTTFHLFFPVKERLTTRVQQEDPGDVRGKGETVLIVEDEEMLVDLVETLLTTAGYRVQVARNGREAVEIYRSRHEEIDVVLSDLGLPELGGIDAFLKMREINPRLRAIFATGYIDDESTREMLQLGASRIMHKPYIPDNVLKAIRSVLDSPYGR